MSMDDIIDYSSMSIDTSALTASIIDPNTYNIGAVGSTGNYYTYTSNGTGSWNTITNPSLTCTGDAYFDGDVKIKGVSIAKALEDIQKRLAILVPDPAKLEHFEALKKAYDHYKVLEAMCELPTTETKE